MVRVEKIVKSATKCPEDILRRPINFLATYTKDPIVHFIPKLNTRVPKMEVGSYYWVPEEYRIFLDCIQYKGDYPYKRKKPDWEMSNKKASRYIIKILDVEEFNLKDATKKQASSFGISSNTDFLPITKPKKFKKPEEVWRLATFFEEEYGIEDAWDNNIPLWKYEYLLMRKPYEYPDYLARYKWEQREHIDN